MKQDHQAIIICGGAPNPYLSHLEKLKTKYFQLKMIGVDRGAWHLIEAGYLLDVAIGDFDSVSEEEYQCIQSQAKTVKRVPSAKDDTDIELALQFVANQLWQGDIYLFGTIGSVTYGRMDHLISNLWLLHQPRFKSLLPHLHYIEQDHHLQVLTPGDHQLYFDHWMDYVSVISLTPVKGLAIDDAKYLLDHQDIDYPRAFISNEFIENQKINVSFKSGIVIIIYVREA